MSSPMQFFKQEHFKRALHLCLAVILLIIVASYSAQASRRLGEPKRNILDLQHAHRVGGARHAKKTPSNPMHSEKRWVKLSLEKGASKIISAAFNFNKIKRNNTNFVMSPFAIQAAIHLRHRIIEIDDDEYKLLDYLGYDSKLSSSSLLRGLQSHIDSLAGRSEFALSFLYIYNWLTPISHQLKDVFEQHHQIDFDAQDPDAREGAYSFAKLYERIHLWAASKTKNHIPGLLTGVDISNISNDYLLTLGHIQADWFWQFKLERTQTAMFYNDGNIKTAQSVPFMCGKESFRYLDSRDHLSNYKVAPEKPISEFKKRQSPPLYPSCDCHMVELPFTDRRFSMIILIPDQLNGLDKLQAIPVTMIKHFMKESKLETIDLKVPKFSISSVFRLDDIFQEHGMRTILKDNFHSGLDTYRREDVETKLIHGSGFSINEQGANVVGAHKYRLHYLEQPTPHRNITIDRPFKFVVMDGVNYVPLVVGQVVRVA